MCVRCNAPLASDACRSRRALPGVDSRHPGNAARYVQETSLEHHSLRYTAYGRLHPWLQPATETPAMLGTPVSFRQRQKRNAGQYRVTKLPRYDSSHSIPPSCETFLRDGGFPCALRPLLYEHRSYRLSEAAVLRVPQPLISVFHRHRAWYCRF